MFLKKKHLLILILGAAVLGTYFQSLFFGLSYLDDDVLVKDNNYVLRDMSNIPKLFRSDVFMKPVSQSYYRPLMNVSLMLDAHLGGKNPFPYHLTNILIHFLVTVLVFYFFLALGSGTSGSFIYGLIFAVHPALSQAVAWIPGRNDSLMALFGLASFVSFIQYVKTRSRFFFFAHLTALLLAFFTKETSVTVIFVCLLYLFLFGKKEDRGRIFLFSAVPWLAITAFWLAARVSAFNDPTKLVPLQMLGSVKGNFSAFFIYLGKLFIPVNLSVMPTSTDSTLLFGVIVFIIILTGLVFSSQKDLKKVFFGAAWFILFLLPVLITEFILEHRNYLPVLGVMLVISELDLIKSPAWKDRQVRASGALILIVFIAVNIIHSRDFISPQAFWKSASESTPSSVKIRLDLGAVYQLFGNKYMALKTYYDTEKLSPNEEMLQYNMGIIFAQDGNTIEAAARYQREIAAHPNSYKAYFNLGQLYLASGQNDKAMEMWQSALAINPANPVVRNSMGYYYLTRGDLVIAENIFLGILRDFPSFTPALDNMGVLAAKRNDWNSAKTYWERSLQKGSETPDTLFNLAVSHLQAGDKKTAGKYYKEFLSRGGTSRELPEGISF